MLLKPFPCFQEFKRPKLQQYISYNSTHNCSVYFFLIIGDAKLCLMLISGGSDVAAVSGEGSSVLHYLAISQNPESTPVVSTILGKAKECPELDINLPDWDGHTPLMK